MRRPHRFTTWALALATVAWVPPPPALADDARAVKLIQAKQYRDAIRLLTEQTAGKRPQDMPRESLLLGECHYLLGDYKTARAHFARAERFLKAGKDRTIVDYRLACCAYRLGDDAGARKRISAFLADHPKDRRVGTLLLFKMKLLARKGREAVGELEALRKRIAADRAKYGYASSFMADKILSDVYIRTGQKDKARDLYARIVHQFRAVISEYTRQKRPVPADFGKVHDEAALQLGMIAVRDKRPTQATVWLENVRYDLNAKMKARLVLAQLAYQGGDFDKAQRYLQADNFIDFVPAGRLKSDMYLLLGLCEKQKPKPSLSRLEGYLSKVGPGSGGFAQAQFALGDLYRERGLTVEAIKAYRNALPATKYAADALFYLGSLTMQRAEEAPDPAKRDALYREASDLLNKLITRHPLSPHVKQANALAGKLRAKGFDVMFAAGDRERTKDWERIAREQAGTPGGALALLNLARYHHREVVDETSGQIVKAPDYAACASACERFLKVPEKALPADGPAGKRWKRLRCEALLMRARAELASAFPAPSERRRLRRPVYLKAATADRAAKHFQAAADIVDPKDREMVKSVELGLIEAMFKSADKARQERARRRFEQLVDDYGTDLRFQKLAGDLAEWYQEQGRFADAGREYRGIAERGKDLPRETLLKTLYLAGSLYSQAAYEAQSRPDKVRFAVYIRPPRPVKLAGILNSYPPLQKQVALTWAGKQKSGLLTGREALQAVSEASGVPFVWSPATSKVPKATIADYLARTKVRVKNETRTVAHFLGRILDLDRHRLVFDIGMTGAEPTIPPPKTDREDPEAPEAVRAIEIYDTRQELTRYPPLARSYGKWTDAHGSGPESKSVMLYGIIRRVEEIIDGHVVWAPGTESDRVLGTEYDAIPGVGRYKDCTCAEALAGALGKVKLTFQVIRRNVSADHYEKAKECFNEVCKIAPKSRYGERSLFALALNYYHQRDHDRMKTVLKHYLKIFDNPSHEYYHRACFWVGWVLEREKRYRDACHYYTLSAEEYLAVYRPDRKHPALTREAFRAQLSYDSRFALDEPISGELDACALEGEFADFIRQNTNLLLKLDPSAMSTSTPVSRPAFKAVPCFDVLWDGLRSLELSCRVEHVDPATAEKAYYRMASAQKKDGQMHQALESVESLLTHWPGTRRLRDALKLKLDIHRGLKDYRSVLATLETLRTRFADAIAPHEIDYEMARIHFDLCRYDKAVEHFRRSMAGAKDPRQRVRIREGYARALFRAGRLADALGQYQALLEAEPEPLRRTVDELMVFYLKFALKKAAGAEFPETYRKLVFEYERLPEARRAQQSKSALAVVTWVYYVQGLMDLQRGRTEAAVRKLTEAGNSPDDLLAADALYRVGRIHMARGKHQAAADTFEYLLFSTRSAEAEVKATYHLGLCYVKLARPEAARKRLEALVKRFGPSPYAERYLSGPLPEALRRAGAGAATAPAGGAKTSPVPEPAGAGQGLP